MSHTSGEVRHVDGNITDRGNQNDILEKKKLSPCHSFLWELNSVTTCRFQEGVFGN